MCKFFSAISNGKGRVKFFEIEAVASIMAKGNPKHYNFNSHSSIADYYKITPKQEDKWNKWEYDVDKKTLIEDQLNSLDDRGVVLEKIQMYLKNKDIGFLRNFYNYNSGHYNYGYCNSGDYNHGHYNSGHYNSGHYNSGNYNSGHYNYGYCNYGHYNHGDYNSGDYNSGHYNSGDYNSGHYNSGNCNYGYRNSGWFNTNEPKARFFNKESDITMTEFLQKCPVPVIGLPLVKFKTSSEMTAKEKKENPNHITVGGYLKILDYKDAWKRFWGTTPKANKQKILNLPNFDKKIFKEITGITVK